MLPRAGGEGLAVTPEFGTAPRLLRPGTQSGNDRVDERYHGASLARIDGVPLWLGPH